MGLEAQPAEALGHDGRKGAPSAQLPLDEAQFRCLHLLNLKAHILNFGAHLLNLFFQFVTHVLKSPLVASSLRLVSSYLFRAICRALTCTLACFSVNPGP